MKNYSLEEVEDKLFSLNAALHCVSIIHDNYRDVKRMLPAFNDTDVAKLLNGCKFVYLSDDIMVYRMVSRSFVNMAYRSVKRDIKKYKKIAKEMQK